MQDDDFEARLKTLSPLGAKVDPVAAAYMACRKSLVWRESLWRGLTALALVAAVVPRMMPKQEPHEVDLPRMVIARASKLTVEPADVKPPGNVWQLEAAVLDKGLDGLPSVPIAPVRAVRGVDTF